MVRYGDTSVLALYRFPRNPGKAWTSSTLVHVDYEEKQYAVGKIPGGFETGRPPIGKGHPQLPAHRPANPALFPKGFLAMSRW